MTLIIFRGVKAIILSGCLEIKWLVMYFTGAKYSHFYVNELCWVLKYTNLHWIVWAFWIMRHFRRVLTMLCNSFISWSLICLHSMISTPISLLVFCKSENGCISLGTEESTIQLKKINYMKFWKLSLYALCT